jgi:hypothetical protein
VVEPLKDSATSVTGVPACATGGVAPTSRRAQPATATPASDVPPRLTLARDGSGRMTRWLYHLVAAIAQSRQASASRIPRRLPTSSPAGPRCAGHAGTAAHAPV